MESQRMPFIGEIVLFYPNPGDAVAKSNYNDQPIPAIITRVWSHGCVNLKIIPDCGAMQDRTSVVHELLNPAGYHFVFLDEVNEARAQYKKANEENEETKNASSYLVTKAEKDFLSMNIPLGTSLNS